MEINEMPVFDIKFPWEEIDLLIKDTLKEDLNSIGDITTDWSVPAHKQGTAVFIAKEKGILAGLPVVERIFYLIDPDLCFISSKRDGEKVQDDEKFATVKGSLKSILTAERTTLNFLQQLSGTATITAEYVKHIKHTNSIVLDTRKTLPRMRWLQKYAVRMGGGRNHRFGLFDMVLIKDNHIDAAGGITNALEACFRELKKRKSSVPVEIETKTLAEVEAAMKFPVSRIMLDNMKPDLMKKAVQMINHQTEIEASGNVSLKTVQKIAETGVDYISVGALTHSVKAFDISLRINISN